MVPMELDATEKCNKALQKKTHKCYHCEKINHLAKVCRNKKQANTTQSRKQKNRKKKNSRKEKQLNAIKTKVKPDHAILSWTACYSNNYYTHLFEK